METSLMEHSHYHKNGLKGLTLSKIGLILLLELDLQE